MTNTSPTTIQKPDRDTVIADLKALVEQQDDFIKNLQKGSVPYATVAYVDTEKLLLGTPHGIVEVERPDFPVRVGQTVAVVAQTGQVIKTGVVDVTGPQRRVSKLVSAFIVEVDQKGESLRVFKDESLIVEEGDSVALDQFSVAIVEIVERNSKKYVKTSTGVTWDDIGGLDAVKKQLMEIVELPHSRPEIFEFYGYTPPKGVLLSGSPGNGKTMLGKAVATAIARIHGGEDGFIYVKGPEVLNMYVGNSEANIRSIFDQARAHKSKTGSPAVIFIDEAEALLSRRGTGMSSDMEKTIVPTFLAEMDGLEETAAVVMLATNRPERLDPAVVRDGRVDRKIEVTRPDEETVRRIAEINLRKTPIDPSTTREKLASLVSAELLCPQLKVYDVLAADGTLHHMTLADLVSGAMVANTVERAKGVALQRDLKEGSMRGLRESDVRDAVATITTEALKVNHDDEAKEFAARNKFALVQYAKSSAGES